MNFLISTFSFKTGKSLETLAMQTGLFLTHPSQEAVSMSGNGDGANAAVSLGEILLGEEALETC